MWDVGPFGLLRFITPYLRSSSVGRFSGSCPTDGFVCASRLTMISRLIFSNGSWFMVFRSYQGIIMIALNSALASQMGSVLRKYLQGLLRAFRIFPQGCLPRLVLP